MRNIGGWSYQRFLGLMPMAELEAGYDLVCTLDWTWGKHCHGHMHAHLHKQHSAARFSSFKFCFARSKDSNPPLLSTGAMVWELYAQ